MFHFWSQFPIVILFVLIGGIVFFYLRNQHKEKLALIEKGESLIHQDALQRMKFSNLARGIITVSLALGVFLAHLLEMYTSLEPVITYISMILLFFGIGSLVFYWMVKNQ